MKNRDRREFLKKMLTLSVFTGVCPHIALGELVPVNVEKKDDNILQGIYELDLEEYPELLKDYGSIKIEVLNSIMGTNHYEGIYVTRVPETISEGRFSILRNICPHEGQYVLPMHPLTKTFTCSGHGSVFNVTGNHVSGPAAQGLTNYQYYAWEPGDRYLRILFDFYVKEGSVEEENLHININNIYPNPCGDITNITYQIEIDSFINYQITDIQGNILIHTTKTFKIMGEYSEEINLSKLPNGIYILHLFINGNRTKSIKIDKSK